MNRTTRFVSLCFILFIYFSSFAFNVLICLWSAYTWQICQLMLYHPIKVRKRNRIKFCVLVTPIWSSVDIYNNSIQCQQAYVFTENIWDCLFVWKDKSDTLIMKWVQSVRLFPSVTVHLWWKWPKTWRQSHQFTLNVLLLELKSILATTRNVCIDLLWTSQFSETISHWLANTPWRSNRT